MSFNFRGVKEPTERATSQFLSPGSGLVLKINNIELKMSQNNNTPLPVFHVESEPITDPNFKGQDGAKGQVGRISANGGYYLKDDNQQQQFMGALKSIARALNKTDELEAIDAQSFAELISKAAAVLRGGYARYFVAGVEFPKPQGKYGVKLVFPSRNFVESVAIDETTLPKFDRNNKKHYLAVPKDTTGNFGVTAGSTINSKPAPTQSPDDLPF